MLINNDIVYNVLGYIPDVPTYFPSYYEITIIVYYIYWLQIVAYTQTTDMLN